MKSAPKHYSIISMHISISVSLLFISYFTISFITPTYSLSKMYVREYTPGENGIKGNVDVSYFSKDPAYEIGANAEGYAVFKHPDRAFRQMLLDFPKGITAIQDEFHFPFFSRWTYQEYEELGWQLTLTQDPKALQQAVMLSAFLDIYDNSF